MRPKAAGRINQQSRKTYSAHTRGLPDLEFVVKVLALIPPLLLLISCASSLNKSDEASDAVMITGTSVDSSEIEGEPVMVLRIDRIDDAAAVADLLRHMNDDSSVFPKKGDYSNCDELVTLIRSSNEVELVEISTEAVVTKTEYATMTYNFPDGDCALD